MISALPIASRRQKWASASGDSVRVNLVAGLSHAHEISEPVGSLSDVGAHWAANVVVTTGRDQCLDEQVFPGFTAARQPLGQ